MIKSNHILYILLVIILVLAGIIIFRKPVKESGSEITKLKNSIVKKDSLIKAYQQDADTYEQKAQDFTDKIDSLNQVKQRVKHIYHDIYKDINTAGNKRLDSIIRANW